MFKFRKFSKELICKKILKKFVYENLKKFECKKFFDT